MLVKLNQILFFFVLFVTFSPRILAADLKSGCYLDENANEVQPLPGTSDERYPIASVSKVFTTLMAVSKFNLRTVVDSKPVRAPFATEFFVRSITTARGKPGYHVHIKGSGDPYFNRFKMHRAISLLNEMQVFEIELLTFDENVKFLLDTDSKGGFYIGKQLVTPLTLKAEVDFPTTDLVKHQYQEFWKMLNDYFKSYKMAKGVKVKMVDRPRFTVRKVEFVSSQNFTAQPTDKLLYVESQSMSTMLKMMNWNSNNYTANRIYTVSGGEAGFKDIFYSDLKVSAGQLTFINGSGQNHDLAGDGPRVYNESSCSVVVRTLRNLHKRVIAQGKKLSDVMAVVGVDSTSTVGGAVYSNEFTTGKVVAKTGTVATNITLAGAINTKSGMRFFMFNVGAKQQGNVVQEHLARKMISERLTALVKSTKDVEAFDYKPNLALMEQYGFENYVEDGEPVLASGAPKVITVTFSAVTPATIVVTGAKKIQ